MRTPAENLAFEIPPQTISNAPKNAPGTTARQKDDVIILPIEMDSSGRWGRKLPRLT